MGFSEAASSPQFCYLVCKRSGGERGEGEDSMRGVVIPQSFFEGLPPFF
jgi:hypothetical protein